LFWFLDAQETGSHQAKKYGALQLLSVVLDGAKAYKFWDLHRCDEVGMEYLLNKVKLVRALETEEDRFVVDSY
jgi:hypothetical protein